MNRRAPSIAGLVLYLLSFLIGFVLWLKAEGGFPVTSRYWWAQGALPIPVLLLHLAAGVLLFRKAQHALLVVVATESMMLALMVSGLCLFWATFLWLAPVFLLRLGAVVMILYGLGISLSDDRRLPAAAAVLGLALGVAWPLTMQPPSEGAHPLLKSGEAGRVWRRAPDADESAIEEWARGLKLDGGAQVRLKTSPTDLSLRVEDTLLLFRPLMWLRETSTDGFWVTKLNGSGMAFVAPDRAVGWSRGTVHYAYVLFKSPQRVQSRVARPEADRVFGSAPVGAELYVRCDPQKGEVDAVTLTHLKRPLLVHRTSLFELRIHPYTGQRVSLPRLGDVTLPTMSDASEPRSDRAWLANLQPGGAVLYEAAGEDLCPLREAARAEGFADGLRFHGQPGEPDVLVYCPDWSTQANRHLSPSAGSALAANELSFLLVRPRGPAAREPASSPAFLRIRASVATTGPGWGTPVVRMAPGTYVNRIAVRFVPESADYRDAVEAIKLWEPNRRQ